MTSGISVARIAKQTEAIEVDPEALSTFGAMSETASNSTHVVAFS